MSQARITLRPPPNVEFVEGYPGIPAGHDRPHAEVRGTIELRLGAQGTKAKWVRVELKKVETLPGGGQSNTFYDFVGQSPVKVWEADGDWRLLHTQDFPFAIRIPESIPPSIALEKGAGIKYELNATLCMKGKKGWFFKKLDPTLSTSHPIIIDKHELHSTWPVYAQPESRHVVDELLMLTVDRTHTCYGPGDKVKVLATFRNDGIPAAALRAFEFLLKETVIFRAGPHVSGKKGAPQVHVAPIGEQKVPVNKTVYQGQQHRAELGCFIPQTHTTTTVSAARHIDIAYSINVKAVLATGKPLLMELPVTVSNWPRNMSIEAVRRIGPSPNLSLISPTAISQRPAPNTTGVDRPSFQSQVSAALPTSYNTAPGRSGPFQIQPHQINERVAHHPGGLQSTANNSTTNQYGEKALGFRRNFDEFGFSASGAGSQTIQPTAHNGHVSGTQTDDFAGEGPRRPPVNTNASRRLTLANAEMDSEPDSPPVAASQPKKFISALEEKRLLQSAMADSPGGSGSSTTAKPSNAAQAAPRSTSSQQRKAWPSAEEEKQRLFNSARQQAQKTQAIMGNYMSPMPSETLPAVSEPSKPESPPLTTPTPAPAPTPKKGTPWPTAEEEKLRLFNEAQVAARRTQNQGLSEGLSDGGSQSSGSPPAAKAQFNERQASGAGSSKITSAAMQIRPTESKSAGAQLYQHAMATMSRQPSAQASFRPTSPPSPPASRPNGSPNASRSRFPTAEEEKAAMRYYEAKRAVDRHQMGGYEQESSSSVPAEEPIAYDALYPAGPSLNQTGSPQMANGSGNLTSGADDRDTEFLRTMTPPPPASPTPHLASSSMDNSAFSEKERLRLKYAAEDAAATSPPSPRATLSRTSTNQGSPPGYGRPPSSRAQPLPPINSSGPRQLTAAEEKARLRAQYEAEESFATGSVNAGPSNTAGLSLPLPASPGRAHGNSSSVSYMGHRSDSVTHNEFVPPPPPPLAPRPPAEYIRETKEEDARTQAEEHVYSGIQATLSSPSHLISSNSNDEESRVDFGLSFRPLLTSRSRAQLWCERQEQQSKSYAYASSSTFAT
ncbi:hypothetical protein DFH11DRAFT_1851743 [Phellopilus nigrolimitatus]|nr:hypothetical protein DFH11DRAFT_1851743 [Phellopilus nigrolimitatus]